MSDGPCLSLRQGQQHGEPPIDLTTFSQWIEIQPVETIVGILDLLGNDLYRRHWPTYADQCKSLAQNMRSTLMYLKHHTSDEATDGA